MKNSRITNSVIILAAGFLFACSESAEQTNVENTEEEKNSIVQSAKDQNQEKEEEQRTGLESGTLKAVSEADDKKFSTPTREVQFYPPPVIIDKEFDENEGTLVQDIDGSQEYFGAMEAEAPVKVEYIPQKIHEEIYTIVDEPAEFPGGIGAMKQYIKDNLVYPLTAKENSIQGKCYLRFVVNGDGSISDVKVARGVADCPECDKEAIRVIKSMPNWKPGTSNGVIVKSYYTLPIAFVMD